MNKYNLIKKKFYHLVFEGTPYEIGQQIAEFVNKIKKSARNFIISGETDPLKLGFSDFEEIQSYMDEFCPSINNEIQGLADGLDVDIKKINYYDWSLSGPPGYFGCTHFAVLGKATSNNHTLSGRSYEWDAEHEDFVFYTTHVNGKPRHMGFSEIILGRTEGLNEHGLAITMSNGGIFEKKLENGRGVMFWLIIRSILENCKTIDEASKFIKKVPVLGFFNFIISDKNEILLVECSDGVKGFKKLGSSSEEFHLSATNSYTLPETIKYNNFNVRIRLNGSRFRRGLVENELTKDHPKITKETIRRILSKNLPRGVCAHWYSTGFGTDWSLIFDNTDPHAEVCFGAPTHNEWRKFTFDTPAGIQEYDVILPDLQE